MKSSLKTKITLYSLLLHAIIWVLAVSASTYTTAEVIFESLDKDLKEQAQFVRFSSRLFRSFYRKFDVNKGYDPLKDGTIISEGIGWTDVNIVIWNMKGKFMYRSGKAPGFDFPQRNGYADDTFIQNGEETHWRLYNENIDGVFWVTVGIDTKNARQSALDLGLKALYPMILIIPLTIIGVYFGTKKGMGAINKITDEVSNRQPNSLVPISENNIPEEIFPLVNSLNGFLLRLKSAIENEHRFTANAAHELQTPLAAIKTELQLCQRRSKNPEVIEVLSGIAARVDRAVYTVKQLLTLARIESENTHLLFEVLDLHMIVTEDLADLAHLAVERNLNIGFSDNESWLVTGSKEVLSILIRNLLTNAFRYAKSGGDVEVGATVSENTIQFYVANDSKQISKHEREKMVDSFYRLPGNEMPGSGLGLAIVQRIVTAHNARLDIDSWRNNEGVIVKVTFNKAQTS